MKKILNLFLVLICLFVFISCDDENYTLQIEVIEDVYVGKTSNFTVKVVEDDKILEDYTFTKDNNNIEVSKGKITGLKAGNAKLTVNATYNKKELTVSKEITVKQEKEYALNLAYEKNLNVGEFCDLVVKETTTNTVINDFQAISSNNDVCKVENGKIYALKAGTTQISISTTFDGMLLSEKIEITVSEIVEKAQTNIPNVMKTLDNVVVQVSFKGTKIDIFTLEVSNEDCLYYDNSTKILEPYDLGKSTITITYTYNGEERTDVYDVEVVEGNTLVVEMVNGIVEDEKASFELFVNPGKIKVEDLSTLKVSFSNNNICKYEDGKIVALRKGNCRIFFEIIYDGSKISTFFDCTTLRKVNKYIVTDLTEYMFLNEVLSINPKLFPYNESLQDLNIKSSDETIISVDNNSLKALKEGTSKITISGKVNDIIYNYELDITVYKFTDITLNIDNEIYLNEVAKYDVIALPSNVKLTRFNYSASENIKLDNNVIFGETVNSGKVEVSFTYNGKTYAKEQSVSVIEFMPKVERLFITGAQGLLLGTTSKLEVTTYPQNAKGEVVYSSSDNNIVTVDSFGVMSALNTGKVVITASLKEDSTIKSIHEVTILQTKEVSTVVGKTTNNDYLGRYYEESIKYYYELKNGVVETTYNAFTSTSTDNIDVDGYTGLSEMIEANKYYPQQVHVLEVPSRKDVKIIPWANLSNHIWTLTTVKAFIQDYEEKHPNQKVICAINGDFFDIRANGNLPYQTTGENVSDGEFYRTSNSHGAGGTLGFTNNGTENSLISDGKATRTTNMILAIYDQNDNIVKEFEVEALNKLCEDGKSSVHFGLYNDSKEFVNATLSTTNHVYYVENASLALPNNSKDFYGKGVISSVITENANIEIKKGQFAIETSNEEIINYLKQGMKIRIQYEFTGKFEEVTGATGYNNLIYNNVDQLHDGYIADRAPRTVLGKKADGTIVMMVIDGRQGADDMYGADGLELAAIMKAYGCVNAYNLDGGGSSTIVVREDSGLKVLNSPSDQRERADGNCILIVSEDPAYKCTTEEVSDTHAKISIVAQNPNFLTNEIYVKMDGKMYKADNGVITFNNLVKNNTYNYKVYYKDNDELIETLTVNSFTTLKNGFTFFGVTLEETADAFIFRVNYSDEDNASNISNMQVNFNSITSYMTSGVLEIKKSLGGEFIENVSFNYWYTSVDEKIDVTLNEYYKIK